MLSEIRINGLGVISSATAELSSGFTALTGETGAGKTMIVTSLHLLSGARADASRVRATQERAVVEGRFELERLDAVRDEVHEVLEGSGAEADEDGSVIATRTVTRDGRSRAYLGGRGVPAGVLSRFTAPLLAVHGQNDQLRLQRPDEQRRALDRFAVGVGPLLERYRDIRTRWLAACDELEERTGKSRELAQEVDRLTFGLQEIDAVDPKPAEDVEIAAEVRRLGELDSLRSAALEAHAALAGASEFDDGGAGTAPGALELAGAARARLATSDDEELARLVPRVDELVAIAGDVASDLAGYLSSLPADADALEGLLVRQAELKALTRKYAADVDGVIAWAEESRRRVAKIDTSAEALAELHARVGKLADEVREAATALSAERSRAADDLAAAVTEELAGLAMGRARLDVHVDWVPGVEGERGALEVDGAWVRAGADGVDAVELRLRAHSGADPLPLGKSASGGELSRVMLALEVVLAADESGGTMVFDEVDAGVGGRAAVEIGRRLARLARHHQVIVVTHLPQVAAFADTHLVVDKVDDGGVVQSGVRTLTDAERVTELARMLAGLDDTETGRAHAEELLEAASAARVG